MHMVGIDFINFTAQNNALHMLSKKGDFGILGGHAPFGPLNPPMAVGQLRTRFRMDVDVLDKSINFFLALLIP